MSGQPDEQGGGEEARWPALDCPYCNGVACWRAGLAHCPCLCHVRNGSDEK